MNEKKATAVGGSVSKRGLITKQKTRDMCFAFSILIPVMLLFTIIRFIPIIQTFIYSFMKKSMIRPGQSFIGLDNYAYVLTDGEFYKSFLNTAFIAVFSVAGSVILGLFLASIVNSGRKGMKFWQALLFLPVIVSMVPATLMWKLLFDFNYGFINQLLNLIGIKSIDWINDANIVRWPIVVIGVWKEMGYNMMIFFVGLKSVPKELYESADLDGVNRRQRLFHITLPMIKPITLFVCVMSLIKFVKVFTQAIVMTSGSQSSGNIFKTFVYYIYQQSFQLHSMGRASAAAMILLLVIFLLTWLQMRMQKDD